MGNTKLGLSCICRSILTTDFSVEFWQAPWFFILPFDSILSNTRPLVTAVDNHCEHTEIMTSTNTVFSGFYVRSSFTLDTKNIFGPVNLHWQKKEKEVTFRTTHLATCLLLYTCVSILHTANPGPLYLPRVHKTHLVRKNHNTLTQHTEALAWF